MKRPVGIVLLLLLLGVIVLLSAGAASAGVGSKVIRETAELLVRRGGKELAGETVETLAKKMSLLAARHGDDLVTAAFTKVGPRAARVASEAGEHSGIALRLLSKHGDDAIRVAGRPKVLGLAARFGDDVAEPLIRHGEIGEKLIERFGSDGAAALGKLSEQNVRRLAILVQQQGDKVTPGLVQLFAKHGHADTVADFVWRNKGALFVGGTIAAFVAAPEPFLNAGETVAVSTLESAVQPTVKEAATRIPWGFISTIGFVIGIAVVFQRIGVPIVVKHWSNAALSKASDVMKQLQPRFTLNPKEDANREREIRRKEL